MEFEAHDCFWNRNFCGIPRGRPMGRADSAGLHIGRTGPRGNCAYESADGHYGRLDSSRFERAKMKTISMLVILWMSIAVELAWSRSLPHGALGSADCLWHHVLDAFGDRDSAFGYSVVN